MPSISHETPVELLRQDPQLILDLLRGVSDRELPENAAVRLTSNDLSDVAPVQFTADCVLVIEDKPGGKPVLAVVVEPQTRDPWTKTYSWPVYVAIARRVNECDAMLLVICNDPAEAEKCRASIRTGHPGYDLAPLVMEQSNTPTAGGAEAAAAPPYLTIFAGCMGAINLVIKSNQHLVLDAIAVIPEGRRATCTALIMATVSEAVRREMEELMQSTTYRNAFIETFEAKGRAEGEAKGEAKGEARSILRVLARRRVELTPDQTRQVQECLDVDQLNLWLDRAVTAKKADDVFHGRKRR
ncbi:MAG TPA: hypothetical protein VN969_45700 [Streptosporangiaceae bacterium]|nr:hypothetical protein [Streptosporangiaceae bacterium]